jgi:hypothetical protein
LRFRANVWVEGWDPWVENDWTGRQMALGEARLSVVKPITRCVATHVDPATGTRDVDVVSALHDVYGHRWCGLYLSVQTGGDLRNGNRVELI